MEAKAEYNRELLSIIILNYNTFEMTCNCINSVLEKTKDWSIEIILVDNASTERNVDDFLVRFPEIVLIKSEQNLGFSKGNNLGIARAKGSILLLLNSDTILLNDAVSICAEELMKREEIGIITCKLRYPNGDIQRQCRRFERISLRLIELLRIHKFWSKSKRAKVLLNGYFDHETEIVADRIWGTFFMFKKEILNEFPENKLADRFFMYGEDNEWCYQLAKFTSKKIVYFPKAEVEHLMGGSKYGKEISKEKMETIHRNRKIYMNQYYGKFRTRILDFLKRAV